MMETLFGSPAPMWTTPLASGYVMPPPLQQPIGFAGAIGPTNLGAVPMLANTSAITSATRGPSTHLAVASAPYPWYPILANPPTPTGADLATGVPAAALLATVALRRGQPQGPSNDQEVEDFIYEALELLPGTSDVEVRCDSGRATLAGVVHHKRIKHDVGELAWAIPGLIDVQNNVTIASRRRARAASGRELEVPANQNRK
jgi:BON domain-containing protein